MPHHKRALCSRAICAYLNLYSKCLILFISLTSLWLLLRSDNPPTVTPAPVIPSYYIPPNWLDHEPSSILEAAFEASAVAPKLNRTTIPGIIHQTYKSLSTYDSWSPLVKEYMNQWVQLAKDNDMAYFLWTDEEMNNLIDGFESPEFRRTYHALPSIVLKSDAFRVTVLKWFGGVYADVDTKPLQAPGMWVQSTDTTPWSGVYSSQTYQPYTPEDSPYQPNSQESQIIPRIPPSASSPAPVSAILGIESDNPRDGDAHWRMGYSHPVQLTQWALAMSPWHPIARRFMTQLTSDVHDHLKNATLKRADPLELTGPDAITRIIQKLNIDRHPTAEWNDVSGLFDLPGGRGKIVAGDVLILPITGFSPGRSKIFQNMGSMSVGHPSARLQHAAVGSWRGNTTWLVTFGKVCRQLGGCKEWSKTP